MHSSISDIARCTYSSEEGVTSLSLHSFAPGSIAVIFTGLEDRLLLQQLQQQLRETIMRAPSLLSAAEAADINHLLFRCDAEERDISSGSRGVYALPSQGPLVYAGLAGACAALDAARKLPQREQQQAPICENLSEGLWLLQYAAERLTDIPTLLPLQQQLQQTYNLLQRLKGYNSLRPYIIDRLFSGVYAQVGVLILSRIPAASGLLSDKAAAAVAARTIASAASTSAAPTAAAAAAAATADPLLLHLALATLQFYAYVPSAPLIWGSHDPSLAAGLPHFATSFMRNWGRDTFIAIKGNLISTG